MSEIWDEALMRGKYHLSTAERLFENFSNYQTKRFLVATLQEMALSATAAVNAYLLYSHLKHHTKIPVSAESRLEIFKQKSLSEIGNLTESILLVFEIKKTEKQSPIEILKKDKILLLENGAYKILTLEKIQSLLSDIRSYMKTFQSLVQD